MGKSFFARFRKWFWIAIGTITLALGILGLFLPLLPTTPFLLLTAFAYAKGSPKLYDWLLRNRWFGGYIRDWREGRGMPLKSKIAAVLLLSITIGYSVLYVVPFPWGKVLLFLVGVAVSFYIITRPTAPR